MTQARLRRLEAALEAHERTASPTSRIEQAQRDAIASLMGDLRAELEEYHAIQEGRRSPAPPHSWEDLPRYLIQMRIARGWTQQELAERCGLKEQQVQRYEATDYAHASLARLARIGHVLGAQDWNPAVERPPA